MVNRLLWILDDFYRAVHCAQEFFGDRRSYAGGSHADSATLARVVIRHETRQLDSLVIAVNCKHFLHIGFEYVIQPLTTDAFNVE